MFYTEIFTKTNNSHFTLGIYLKNTRRDIFKLAISISFLLQFTMIAVITPSILDGGNNSCFAIISSIIYWPTVIFLIVYNQKNYSMGHCVYILAAYLVIFGNIKYLDDYIYYYHGKRYVCLISFTCLLLATILFVVKKYRENMFCEDHESVVDLD